MKASRQSALAAIGFIAVALSPATSNSGVRDAPGAALQPAAFISDLYAFRSWEDPTRAVLIMSVAPNQDPGDGPDYFGFDDDVLYRFHIDNNMNARAADVIYEISFRTEQRPALGRFTFPLPYVANPLIVSQPQLRAITALDGPGSEGITRQQTYTVTEIRGKRRVRLFSGVRLIAVPSNVGPVTMPDYESLAAQGIYSDAKRGIRVFAGQRADSSYGDTGALFDGAAPRRVPPVLSPDEDNDHFVNPFGRNRNAGFNVQTIALEIPIERLTRDQRPADGTRTPLLGVYASAHRVWNVRSGWDTKSAADELSAESSHGKTGPLSRQVSRRGNPLVNTLIIDVPNKDRYNRSRPEYDRQYAAIIADPPLARPPVSEIFGIPLPPPPRLDLVSIFLQYPGTAPSQTLCPTRCADLLRLNVNVAPTPPEQQHRLGALLGGDPAGVPNGLRPNDDPLDVVVRLIGGPGLIFARISDGVNFASGTPGAGTSDGPGYGRVPGNRLDVTVNGIVKEFPFLATPHDGRTSTHAP